MQSHLRWRIALIFAVIALSFWAFYPPGEKIKLGLDLRGGVQLRLRVDTDTALRRETETTVERLREALRRRDIDISVLATTPTTFTVDGVRDHEAFRRASLEVEATFERSSHGDGYIYRMRPSLVGRLRDETVTRALQTIERRVNALGATEPLVARYGSRDQILVQLPGTTDVQRARAIIGSTALLEKKLVEQGPFPSEEAARHVHAGTVPSHLEVLPSDTGEHYIVQRTPIVTGTDLRHARPALDEFNRPIVSFTLSQDAARRFGPFTEAHLGRVLAIVLDGRIVSAPRLDGRIDDRGQIYGSFTSQQAQDLSLMLRSGALPARLEYLEQHTVSASLGADSIRAGVTASVGGLLLVVLCIVWYYRPSGVIAVASLLINLLMLLGLVAYLGRTMTLPGIAGLVLTIGMGVDSNVLIFERIKEELAGSQRVRAAVHAGFDRVRRTIVDTHVSSLLTAAFLFQFGTGPIRGFATTLSIGLLTSMFTALFVSRTLVELMLRRRRSEARSLIV